MTARSGIGNILLSDTRPVSPTTGLVRIGLSALTAPTQPQSPAVNTTGGVSLSWSAPASDGGSAVTGYKVYRGTTSGVLTLLVTLGNVTAYSDATALVNTVYYYRISAINSVGEGVQSAEVNGSFSASTLASDSFTRADNTGTSNGLQTSSGGQSWVQDIGVIGINGNAARGVNTSGGIAFTTIDCGVANCSVQAKFTTAIGNDNGLILRAVSSADYFVLFFEAGTLYLQRKGSAGNLTITSTAITLNSGDVLKATMSGSSFGIYVNGVSVMGGTSSSYSSATKHGLFLTDATTKMDDFQVTVP